MGRGEGIGEWIQEREEGSEGDWKLNNWDEVLRSLT
jgi:hypothetical protein